MKAGGGGFPVALGVENSPANAEDARDAGSIHGLGRSPGEGNGNPLQLFLPGKSHGERSLAGYSPWSHKESDTTEHRHVDDLCSISLPISLNRFHWLFLFARSGIWSILCQSLGYRLASSFFFFFWLSHLYQQKFRIIDTQDIYNYLCINYI